MSEQSDSSASNQINQNTQGDRNQIIGQVHGGIVVYVSGGQAIINAAEISEAAQAQQAFQKLGPNPYKGLLAFNENDGKRYFGRSAEIQTLWGKFGALHEGEGKTRLLPIYGPSGSGKSSLARAGLLDQLSRSPLPGRERARIAVFVPGTRPLESLATILARTANKDQTPAQKTREFAEELSLPNRNQEFDGLQRIASVLPDISTFPLIVLVDQFEEVYSLCKDKQERARFIANLLYAASDRTQYVSVILTCRSDFLGATQQYPELNKLFSTQGFLVPIMQPEDLATAIAEPAKQEGYAFDSATVQLLVEQTRGHQGALPLLQFALKRIWEGLKCGYEPLVTLEEIGGVGGALADKAQQLYKSLNKDEQEIAPRIFVALVQVDEGSEITRRRVRKSELITSDSDKPLVESIIKCFSESGIRFLVTFFTDKDGEVIEVAHEALIHNWVQLQEWISKCKEDLWQKRKIENEAEEWKSQEKNKDFLLRGRRAEDARLFSKMDMTETKLSSLAEDFVTTSWIQERSFRWKMRLLKSFPIIFLISSLSLPYFWLLSRAQSVLATKDCQPRPEARFVIEFMILAGFKQQFRESELCGIALEGISLSGADISSSNLARSDFAKADFSEADLSKTSFQEAFLLEVDFQRAFLEKTNFQKATLELANFQGSYLADANFADANLRAANLKGTILIGTNFSNANLTDANLENSQGLTLEQLEKANLCRTKLPNDMVALINLPDTCE